MGLFCCNGANYSLPPPLQSSEKITRYPRYPPGYNSISQYNVLPLDFGLQHEDFRLPDNFPMACQPQMVYHVGQMKQKSRPNANEWIVLKPEAGTSIQEFLALHMKVSKRVAKQHIDARVVRVNGKNIWIAHHVLKQDDVVVVLAPVASPTAISNRVKKLTILFEDADYLVVDKPRGILTNESDFSLESIIRTQTGIATIQASHRLDRDTTGCLLMSKTQAAHDAVIEVFKQHHVIKTYRTVVYGRWDARASTIELPIDGERALTHVHCLFATNAASHLSVRIETGRTHQIRRHLAMARHPVVGDTQYGPKLVEDERLKRLTYPLLHSVELEMEHPTKGGTLKVFSPLPQDFHRWLLALKLIEPK